MYVASNQWAVYNEIEEYAADWLENLIALGVIAPGVVDRRSIVDVRPDDYRGFRQVHLFAGIGVWSYALRCAGVPDDAAVWTLSCPCQPFSAAGQGGGVDDERHLWPAALHLVRHHRPPRFYGEQVASKDGLGWLDLVFADVEAEDYALWAVDTCSAGSGAPHIRQRLRLCADDLRLAAGGLQHAARDGRQQRWSEPSWGRVIGGCASDRLASGHDDDGRADLALGGAQGRTVDGRGGATLRLDDGLGAGLEGLGHGHRAATGQRQGSLRPVATAGGIEWMAQHEGFGSGTGLRDFGKTGNGFAFTGHHSTVRAQPNRPGPTNGFWRDADWLFCRDGKWRPTQPSTFPLVDGSAFRVGSGSPFEGKSRQGMLKGYGNAVDLQATIDFIEATLEPDTIDVVANGAVDADLLI